MRENSLFVLLIVCAMIDFFRNMTYTMRVIRTERALEIAFRGVPAFGETL